MPSGTLAVGRRRSPPCRTGAPAADGLIFEAVRRPRRRRRVRRRRRRRRRLRRSTSTRLLAAAGAEIVAGGAGDPIVYVHTLTPTAVIRRSPTLARPVGRRPRARLRVACRRRAGVDVSPAPASTVVGAAGGRRRRESSIGRWPAATSTPSRWPRLSSDPTPVDRPDGARRRRGARRPTQWLTARSPATRRRPAATSRRPR